MHQTIRLSGRRSLRSTGTNCLLVPAVKRSTVGSHAFPVAGPKTWNALSEDVTSSQSEYTFPRQLKTWLFKKSFPGIIICILTFSLGLFVPTLRRFCRLRSTIWYDMIYDDMIYKLVEILPAIFYLFCYFLHIVAFTQYV